MKELKLTLIIIFLYFFSINIAHPNIKEKIINKLEETKTLSFNFTQKIAEKEETGNCFIKYPLLIKCDYENLKEKMKPIHDKILISLSLLNGQKYYKVTTVPIKNLKEADYFLSVIQKNGFNNAKLFIERKKK